MRSAIALALCLVAACSSKEEPESTAAADAHGCETEPATCNCCGTTVALQCGESTQACSSGVCDPWCSIVRDEDTGIFDGATSDGDAASDGASEATTDAPADGG